MAGVEKVVEELGTLKGRQIIGFKGAERKVKEVKRKKKEQVKWEEEVLHEPV